jgi:hypothetical protein
LRGVGRFFQPRVRLCGVAAIRRLRKDRSDWGVIGMAW